MFIVLRLDDFERRILVVLMIVLEWLVGRFSLSRLRLICIGKYLIFMRRFSVEIVVFCNFMDFKIC